MNLVWNGRRLPWAVWLIVAVAIFLFITQGLASSSLKSASFDEQYHLAAGYSYLRTGDFRLATTHPPLMGLLGGAGLLGNERDCPALGASELGGWRPFPLL